MTLHKVLEGGVVREITEEEHAENVKKLAQSFIETQELMLQHCTSYSFTAGETK